MTARQKFNEAAYFYNRMLEVGLNFQLFQFYLSAFLSALRSITFYLQKQYADDERFREWYAGKQDEMQNDRVLKVLNKQRVGVVHREPMDLHYDLGFRWREEHGDFIETTQFEVSIATGEDGSVKMRMKPNANAPEEDVAPHIKWVFRPDDDTDLTLTCRAGLEKMDEILRQLEELRVGAGLPADDEMEQGFVEEGD